MRYKTRRFPLLYFCNGFCIINPLAGGDDVDGTRLKEQRRRKGLTVQQLADMVGVSRVSASRWESNVYEPDDAMKRRLAELLGVTVAYLMGEADDPAEPEGVAPAPKFRASQDLDRMMRDLAAYDPDFGVLFRGTVTKWSQLPDKTKERIAQIFKVGLGLADVEELGGTEITSDDQL